MPTGIRATVVLAAALAAWPGAAPTDAPPRSGERLTYAVAIGPFEQAATARIDTLDRSVDGFRLRAEVQSESLLESIYPLHYILLTTASAPDLMPLRSSRRAEDRGGASFLALRFDHAGDRVLLSDRAGAEPFAAAPILPDTRDLLSALFHVRARAFEAAPLETTLWEDGLYRIQVERIDGEEVVRVPAGKFPAVRYRVEARPLEGEPQVRDITIWLSADARHLPVKLRAETILGPLEASLTAHEQPEGG